MLSAVGVAQKLIIGGFCASSDGIFHQLAYPKFVVVNQQPVEYSLVDRPAKSSTRSKRE